MNNVSLLYLLDVRVDLTRITYEWRTLIAISTQENQQIKGTNFMIFFKILKDFKDFQF